MTRKKPITIEDGDRFYEALESLKDNIMLAMDDKSWRNTETDLFADSDWAKQQRDQCVKESLRCFESFPAYKHAIELDKAFLLGSGIHRPEDKNPLIQYVIDEVWQSAENQETFTGYAALARQIEEQQLEGEVFYLIYVNETTGESTVRVNDDSSKIKEVITMKGDKDKILFYQYEQTYSEYDYAKKKYITKKVTTFIPAITATMEELKAEVPAINSIQFGYEPKSKTRLYGYLSVVHRHKKMPHRGFPPYRTAFKWAEALKQIASAAATMAKAKSKLAWKIAFPDGVGKTVMTGLKRSLDAIDDQLQLTGQPKADASTLLENSKKGTYEAVDNKLNQTGYRDTTTILMQQLASAFDKNEHYFGNPENANLATATSMELPILKSMETLQQSFLSGLEKVLRFCVIKRYTILTGSVVLTRAKAEGYDIPEDTASQKELIADADMRINSKTFTLTIYAPEILTKDFNTLIAATINAYNAGLIDGKTATMITGSALNLNNAGDIAAEMFGDLDPEDAESQDKLNAQNLALLLAEIKKLSGGSAAPAPKPDDKTDDDNGGDASGA